MNMKSKISEGNDENEREGSDENIVYQRKFKWQNFVDNKFCSK
jgi:hypothetical protein